MKILKNGGFAKSCLALAISAALTGCFDNDDNAVSVGSSGQTTTFNVNLGNAPTTLASTGFDWSNPLKSLVQQAYADTTGLSEESFKVLIVDADGNVTEVFELTADQVTESPAGSGNYIIEAPGVPQLNCVIAVNVDGELVVEVGDPLAQTNSLFAPTTATEIDLDLESTVAYQQFLETVTTFDDYDVDDPGQVAAVEQLVNNVEQQLEALDLDTYLADGNIDLEDLLSGQEVVDENGQTVNFDTVIDQIVQETIDEQIAQIEDAVTTSIVSLMNDGGFYWMDAEARVTSRFQSDGSSPYPFEFEALWAERGFINANGAEVFYEFDFDTEQWVEEQFDSTADTPDDDFVLTANGWVNTADSFELVSVDETEGSVLIQDSQINTVQATVSTLQAIDLEGKNIEDFIGINADLEDFAVFIDSDAVFSTGATGVKIGFTATNTNYFLRYEEGMDGVCYDGTLATDLGGNCDRVYLNSSASGETSVPEGDGTVSDGPVSEEPTESTSSASSAPTSLDQLISTTAATADDIATSSTAFWLDMYHLVHLVDGTDGRDAQYFKVDMSGANGPVYELITLEDGSTPSWDFESPTGLAEGEQMIVFTIPDEVRDNLEFDDEGTRILSVNAGFVRHGAKVIAGEIEEEGGEWVFNGQANTDVVNAFDPIYQDAFLVNCDYNSPFDDAALNGFGAPSESNTFKAFLKLINDPLDEQDFGSVEPINFGGCGGALTSLTADDLTGTDWIEFDEPVVFNADGTGTFDGTISFNWSLNNTAGDGIPDTTVTLTGTATEGDITTGFTEYWVPVGEDTETGSFSFKIFSMIDVWYESPTSLTEGTGEIWSAVLQPDTGSEAVSGEETSVPQQRRLSLIAHFEEPLQWSGFFVFPLWLC